MSTNDIPLAPEERLQPFNHIAVNGRYSDIMALKERPQFVVGGLIGLTGPGVAMSLLPFYLLSEELQERLARKWMCRFVVIVRLDCRLPLLHSIETDGNANAFAFTE
jgi:hypothetical protein